MKELSFVLLAAICVHVALGERPTTAHVRLERARGTTMTSTQGMRKGFGELDLWRERCTLAKTSERILTRLHPISLDILDSAQCSSHLHPEEDDDDGSFKLMKLF